MSIDWQSSPKTKPNSISEMALPSNVKEILLRCEKKGDFRHCIMAGSYGTGKTTSARILARLIDEHFVEHDCNIKGSKDNFLELTKNLLTQNLYQLVKTGTSKRVVILDEFHDADQRAQNVFKKFMEDWAEKVKVIICVNDYNKVSPAISDRCVYLDFDVAVLDADKRTGKPKLLIHPDTGFNNADEWIAELERTVDIIAKKLGVKLTKKMKESVRSNPHNLQSVRSYVRSMQNAYEDFS